MPCMGTTSHLSAVGSKWSRPVWYINAATKTIKKSCFNLEQRERNEFFMKKKVLIKVFASVLATVTLLSGCSDSGSTTGSEDADTAVTEEAGDPEEAGEEEATASEEENIEITFSWWGSDDRHTAMQEVASLYEAENPNVTVNVEYGAWDGWQTKVLTQLSGKTEPDVMQVNYNWVHSFGKGQNVFYDLNQLTDNLTLSNWAGNYLEAMAVGGEQAAVPHGMTGRVQMYNKPLFEENNLEFPATYEEVLAAAAVIGADNTDTGAENKYVLMNVGNESRDLFIAQMLYNRAGKVMQEAGKVNYTEEEVQAILELYKSMEDAGAIPTFQQDDPIQNESNPVWTGGRVGSVYEWAGTLDKYVLAYKGGGADAELGIAPYITEEAGQKPVVYVKPNLGYAVSRNSEHPDVAADFIDFMFTNEGAVKALKTTLGISSNTVTMKIQEDEGMITGKVKEGYDLLDSYDQAVLDPYFEDENVRGQRLTVIEAFRTGKIDSAEAAKQYIEKQQEELTKLYEE